MDATRHTTVINHDARTDVRVVVSESSGWWFKVWCDLIDSGLWAKLSGNSAKVYIVLAKRASSKENRMCWPSVPLIESESGVSKSGVYQSINELEAHSLIRRLAPGKGRESTMYQLIEPKRSPTAVPNGGTGFPRSQISEPPSRPHGNRMDGLSPLPSSSPTPPVSGPLQNLDPSRFWNSAPQLDSSRELEFAGKRRREKNGDDGAPLFTSGEQAHTQARSPSVAAAVALLEREGFQGTDLEELSKYGEEAVRDQIDNRDDLEKCKKATGPRRAWIVNAIRNRYSLRDGVLRARRTAAVLALAEMIRPNCTNDADAKQRAFHAIKFGYVKVEEVSTRTLAEIADLWNQRASGSFNHGR